MKKIALLLLVGLLSALLLGACQTTKGFGRDMENAGSWIEDKATKAE